MLIAFNLFKKIPIEVKLFMKAEQTFKQVRKIKPTLFSVSGYLPFRE